MKLIFFLLLFVPYVLFADSTYVSPSLYYTYGDHSDSTVSNDISFYNTLHVAGGFYLVNYLSLINLDNPTWKYQQKAILAGGFQDFFPFILKFNYAHYNGEYDYKPFTFEYSEYTNLYNAELVYFYDTYYFGASFTYLHNFGFESKYIRQLTLRLEKIISYPLFISIRPNYTKDHVGKDLFSVYGKVHYLPHDRILLKAGGFAGKRAYYFDNDLLTIFNQPDVQKYQLFFTADYFPSYTWKITAGYQYTKFSMKTVNYFTLGVKLNLWL